MLLCQLESMVANMERLIQMPKFPLNPVLRAINPFETFSIDPDFCMGMLINGADFSLDAGSYGLAKTIGLEVANVDSPSIASLLEAWGAHPDLEEFVHAVRRAFLPD